MSKGYDSAERESRERRAEPSICEGYACVELATHTVHGHGYCEAHRPSTAGPPGSAGTLAD